MSCDRHTQLVRCGESRPEMSYLTSNRCLLNSFTSFKMKIRLPEIRTLQLRGHINFCGLKSSFGCLNNCVYSWLLWSTKWDYKVSCPVSWEIWTSENHRELLWLCSWQNYALRWTSLDWRLQMSSTGCCVKVS